MKTSITDIIKLHLLARYNSKHFDNPVTTQQFDDIFNVLMMENANIKMIIEGYAKGDK